MSAVYSDHYQIDIQIQKNFIIYNALVYWL